ncbi:MAG TPA: hypothetical protein VHA82_12760 [Ramlibacter sp.]|uniref:hypothetical protein n=1 Tax=Ramlibacter sp. TaxID=1917967 RepID=UPI002CCD1CEF|nr:hypothetical protein [Ramlibacter sp.]HVZ44673.1 hypothetical protein [Ramlibacter sp.]
MERVWGPVKGFYIAAYAAPAGDGDRYCSYAKVSVRAPANYWDADEVVFKLFGGEYHSTPEAALLSAQLVARNAIGAIPPGALTLLELGLHSASKQLIYSVGSSIRHRMA